MQDQPQSSVDESQKPSVDEVVMNVPPTDEANGESASDKLPRWLRKLQNESWQAEMLVSGGAIFALFGTYDLIDTVSTHILYSTEIPYESFVTPVITMMGMIAFVLIVGFVVHLVMRGYWIGLIGMNYVYPRENVVERLKFAGRFASSFRNTSNNEFIVRLDRYCSMIFALTFQSLFTIAGLIMFITIAVLMPTLFSPELASRWVALAFFVYGLVFMLMGLITLVDFVLGGRLKRIRWFSIVYYPLYKIVSFITLSFVYRRLYYTLASNMGGFRLAMVLATPIALIIVIGLIFDDTGTGLSDSLFRKNAAYSTTEEFLSIESEVVDGASLDVFVTHPIRLEEPAFEKWKLAHTDVKAEDFSELTPEQQMDIIQQLYLLKIDGKQVRDTQKWFINKSKPNNEFMDMRRIVLRKSIDLAGLNPGPHELAISIDLDPKTIRSYAINKEDGNHARIAFLLRRKPI